jgi:hypothetical protein
MWFGSFTGLLIAMSEKAVELKTVISTEFVKPLKQFVNECVHVRR